MMGSREIKTLEKIFSISYSDNIEFSGKKILDLGAGDEFLRIPIAARNGDYMPLDIDQINFDVDPLPYANGSIDIVISLAVIEHINNIDHFLTEIRRVLKSGGILYLTTPNFKYCYKTFYNDPTHVRPFTEVSLLKLIEIYSFRKPFIYPALRCKPGFMYKRKRAFFKAAWIPFVKKPFINCPEIFYGRATSLVLIAAK